MEHECKKKRISGMSYYIQEGKKAIGNIFITKFSFSERFNDIRFLFHLDASVKFWSASNQEYISFSLQTETKLLNSS